MLARVFGRVGLVEKVPASLPEAQPVGVVERVFRVDIMIDRAVGIGIILSACGVQARHERIRCQLGFLFGQRLRKGVVGDQGSAIRVSGGCHLLGSDLLVGFLGQQGAQAGDFCLGGLRLGFSRLSCFRLSLGAGSLSLGKLLGGFPCFGFGR